MSKISVDAITDEAGTGAPSFPNGISATGTVTATTFSGSGASLTGIDAFKPVAVTGTTPSLNVGDYNFFNQGEITADTTISFASVPTNARWTYTYTAVLTTGYDLTASSTTILNELDVSSRDPSPYGLFFRDDGLKLYMLGYNYDKVYEYDMSVAWDITTAVFLQDFSVASQDSSPHDVWFSSDGTDMYVLGRAGNEVNQYSLSTGWNISTASYVRVKSLSSQSASVGGLTFKPDGTVMYMSSLSPASVFEYALSTPYNIATASLTTSFSVSSQESQPYGVEFKPDGLAMFITGPAGDDVNEYTMTSAWDTSSASFTRVHDFDSGTSPKALRFKNDGYTLFILDGGKIREYFTGAIATLTVPASVQNPPIQVPTVSNVISYDFYTSDGGTNVYLINEEIV